MVEVLPLETALEYLRGDLDGVKKWNEWRHGDNLPNRIPSFAEQDLSRCRLVGVHLSQVDLSRSNLSSSNLYQARLEAANLSGADLSRAKLAEARCHSADLSGACLARADLHKADLSRAKLHGTDFQGAGLGECRFNDTVLAGVDLREADLRSTDFRRANFHGLLLDGARLTNDTALSGDACLLDAEWTTLTIEGVEYSREAIERREQILPFGMGDPIRFVFGIEGDAEGPDFEAIRELVRSVSIAKDTHANFELTPEHDRLVIEGRGPTAAAGNVAGLLMYFASQLNELTEGQRLLQQGQDQELMMLARQGNDLERLRRVVSKLYCMEIQLRSEEEVVAFRDAIEKCRLGEFIGVSGRTVTIVKALQPVIKLVLEALGLKQLALALEAVDDSLAQGKY